MLSRHTLDARLATAFVANGGDLITHRRIELGEIPPGRVFANGRRRTDSPWLGLKQHVRGLLLDSELELHLGDHAYVGLCEVEDGLVNVCGIFRQRPGVTAGRTSILSAYLRSSGLSALATRMEAAEISSESCSAVAGMSFAAPIVARGRIELGDAFAMIPPFAGHGMALAFESAVEAVDPLLAWSRHQATWEATIRTVNRRLRRHFRRRLVSARALHPLLLSPRIQPWIATAARSGCLPLRPLYHLLH